MNTTQSCQNKIPEEVHMADPEKITKQLKLIAGKISQHTNNWILENFCQDSDTEECRP